MAKIDTVEDLFKHYSFAEECKLDVYQLFNAYGSYFLKPLTSACLVIKRQIPEYLQKEKCCHGHYHLRSKNEQYALDVYYTKETLEIDAVRYKQTPKQIKPS